MQADIGGNRVSYAVSGSGPWLVLAHSLASQMALWDRQAALLEAHFTVLRYDIRGHGGSGAPPGAYAITGLADDAHALLGHLGVERATWVGLSLGGMVGQALALAHPVCIERLVLADTTAGYGADGKAAWNDRVAAVERGGMEAVANGTLERWFTAGFRQRAPEAVERARRWLLATPPAGFIGCGRAIQALDLWDALPAIACPTAVIVGAEDGATPPAMAERLARSIAGAELTVIADAAHISCIEQPDAFDAALTRFLRL